MIFKYQVSHIAKIHYILIYLILSYRPPFACTQTYINNINSYHCKKISLFPTYMLIINKSEYRTLVLALFKHSCKGSETGGIIINSNNSQALRELGIFRHRSAITGDILNLNVWHGVKSWWVKFSIQIFKWFVYQEKDYIGMALHGFISK